jgi:hypothetical protein
VDHVGGREGDAVEARGCAHELRRHHRNTVEATERTIEDEAARERAHAVNAAEPFADLVEGTVLEPRFVHRGERPRDLEDGFRTSASG